MTRIAVQHLRKEFGKVTAVDDVSFELLPGVTGFLGPNGAGKTTTLRMMLGLIRPTAGRATFDGRRYAELEHPARVVGAMLEATGFHPGRTGRDHLRVVAGAAGVPDRVDEVLELVDLTEAAGRRVSGYSLGMRQRLGLAAALLGDPELLILDEPSNGLDPAGMAWLRDLLRRQAELGRAVLVSSHLLAELAQSVERLVVLNGGRLVYEGRLTALTGHDESLEQAFLRVTAEGGVTVDDEADRSVA
jgi:ABC-2 type transport system ATP-binding protein